MCIRHVSVVPLYIMSVKRWVQVCTCTDSSVQIHSQSNPSWHNIPDIACIWLAMTIILTASTFDVKAIDLLCGDFNF